MPRSPTASNRLLARISAQDLELLGPLSPVELPLRTQLERPNEPIAYAYFIDSGIASVVANGSGLRSIEVGLIGREGVSGLAVIMGGDRSPHDTYMQVAGSGRRMDASALRSAMSQSATLSQKLLQYGHGFLVQIAQTALANGRSKLEDRLARWLLMAHDRVDSPEFLLTHEFLATMLGVHRPGVTVALNLLEKAGLITAQRGLIAIVDREGLEQSSNGAYGPSEAELHRVFG